VHADQREIDERFRAIVGSLNPTRVATDLEWVRPPHVATEPSSADRALVRLGAVAGVGVALAILVAGLLLVPGDEMSATTLVVGLVLWLLLVLPGAALLGATLAPRARAGRPSP
jgi:hypothetical protein